MTTSNPQVVLETEKKKLTREEKKGFLLFSLLIVGFFAAGMVVGFLINRYEGVPGLVVMDCKPASLMSFQCDLNINGHGLKHWLCEYAPGKGHLISCHIFD